MMRASRIFPFTLVTLMAGISFWLDSVSRIEDENKPLDPDKPEFVAEGVTAKRFDELGFLKEHMVAKKIWQFPNNDNIHLDTPDIGVYELGVKKYQIESKTGQYNNKTKQAYFEKDVTMTKLPEPTQPQAVMVTSKLNVDTVAGIAGSKEKVDFSYGDSKGSAIGFLYNQKTGFLNLKSRVSVTYEVPEQR